VVDVQFSQILTPLQHEYDTTDMLKFLMMFLGKENWGVPGFFRKSSVAAMGTDQTPGKFSPVLTKESASAWLDTVSQPAFKSWHKRHGRRAAIF